MKNRGIISLFVIVIIIALVVGCGNTSVSELIETVGSTVTGDSEIDEEVKEDTVVDDSNRESKTEETYQISGVILEATMNNITIQTEDGRTLDFALEDATDRTGLQNGIILGDGITLTYTGEIQDNDTSGVVVLAENDSGTTCTDSEALAVAGEVIMSLESGDYEKFLSLCSYPLLIEGESESTISDQESFEKIYGKDDIFTDDFIDAISEVNLLVATDTEEGLLIGSLDQGIYIIIGNKEADRLITEIHGI